MKVELGRKLHSRFKRDTRVFWEQGRQVLEHLAYLRDTYGLHVKMGRQSDADSDDYFLGKKITLAESQTLLRILREELGKYPPEYILRCDIRMFRMAKEVFEKDEKDSQKKNDSENNSEAESDLLPLEGVTLNDRKEVCVASDTGDMDNFKRNIHHELQHRADSAACENPRNEKKSGKVPSYLREAFFDRGWAHLNVQGELIYMDDDYELKEGQDNDDEIKGFASRYGTINEHEDRATIMEDMMIKPERLFHRAEDDRVLQRKVRRMKRILSERTNGLMDEQYFEDLLAGKVKEGYWSANGNIKK